MTSKEPLQVENSRDMVEEESESNGNDTEEDPIISPDHEKQEQPEKPENPTTKEDQSDLIVQATEQHNVDSNEDQGGFKDWLKRNPKKAAFYGVTGLVIGAPALVAAPILGGLGFTALGHVAGSIAAGAQAAGGTVAAGGLFATLQSAAMGGYGAVAVNGAIQGGTALGAGAKLYHDKLKRKNN